MQDALDCEQLHIYKSLNWIDHVQVLLGDVDLLECLPLVQVGPVVDDWAKSDGPLSLIESQLFITNRSETLELVDDLVRVESLHRSVDVSG